MDPGADTSAICSLKVSHMSAWKRHPVDTLPIPEVTTDDLSTSWLVVPAAMLSINQGSATLTMS